MWHRNITVQVSLKLDESEWSDKFSLDTVGNVGKIECKVKNQNDLVNYYFYCSNNCLSSTTPSPFHLAIARASDVTGYICVIHANIELN